MAISQSTIDTILAAAQGSTKATGTITITTAVPTADDTLTINGTVYTYKAAASLPTEITIGGTLAACATNTAAALNANSFADSSKTGLAHYSASGAVVTVTYNTGGTAGNAFTMVTSNATNIVLSGATLSSGSNGTATSFDSDAITGGGVAAARINSVFEANVIALAALADYVISTATLDPSLSSANYLAAKQQRKVIRQLARCIAESVKGAADSTTDDRSTVAGFVKAKVLAVYNTLARPDAL